MNNVVMIGRLTKDPELKHIAGSGKAIANFTIAVNREFTKSKEADFFRVIVWGIQAENVAKFFNISLFFSQSLYNYVFYIIRYERHNNKRYLSSNKKRI